MYRVVLVVGTLAVLSGCGRYGFDSELSADGTDAGPDAMPETEFDNSWTVTVDQERQDGPADLSSPDDLPPGTEGLSLNEAIVIACNTTGTDEIIFDPAAFGESAQITVTEPLPPIDCDDILIDGTGANVLISAPGVDSSLLTISGARVTIRGLRFFDIASVAIVSTGADTTLEGLELAATSDAAISLEGASAGRVQSVTILNSLNDGISIVGGSDHVINGATITDTTGYAVRVSGATAVELSESTIERAGPALAYFENSTQHSIKGNFMVVETKDTQKGLHLVDVDDSYVGNNIIDPGVAHLINLTDSTGNTIERNILDRGEAGIVLEGVSTANLIFANAVYQPLLDGIYLSSTSTGNTVVHNTLLNCPSPIVDSSGDATLGNNLTSNDPADFKSPAAPDYDFTLAEGSANIDAGSDLGYDCVPDGPEMYLGSAPDLGAVETQ